MMWNEKVLLTVNSRYTSNILKRLWFRLTRKPLYWVENENVRIVKKSNDASEAIQWAIDMGN